MEKENEKEKEKETEPKERPTSIFQFTFRTYWSRNPSFILCDTSEVQKEIFETDHTDATWKTLRLQGFRQDKEDERVTLVGASVCQYVLFNIEQFTPWLAHHFLSKDDRHVYKVWKNAVQVLVTALSSSPWTPHGFPYLHRTDQEVKDAIRTEGIGSDGAPFPFLPPEKVDRFSFFLREWETYNLQAQSIRKLWILLFDTHLHRIAPSRAKAGTSKKRKIDDRGMEEFQGIHEHGQKVVRLQRRHSRYLFGEMMALYRELDMKKRNEGVCPVPN